MKGYSTNFWSYAWPFLLVVLLVGSISYMDPQTDPLSNDLPTGKYLIESEIEGERNMLDGPVYFDYSIQRGNLGDKKVFKLQFVNSSLSKGTGFGFLIPIGDVSRAVDLRTYEVENEKSNFLNDIDAVFGYADLPEESSLYFAESGRISILGSSQEEVTGNINVIMNDGKGKSFKLKGSFRARPMPESIKS